MMLDCRLLATIFTATAAAMLAAPVLGAATMLAAGAAPETAQCLSNRDFRDKTLSSSSGYFVRTSKGWWRNTGPACAVYARNRALATRSPQDRQCKGDLVTVFDPYTWVEFGGCVLGDWQRVSAPPKD